MEVSMVKKEFTWSSSERNEYGENVFGIQFPLQFNSVSAFNGEQSLSLQSNEMNASHCSHLFHSICFLFVSVFVSHDQQLQKEG